MGKSSLVKVVSLIVFCLLGTIQIVHAWPRVENGIAVCTSGESQWYPEIVSDGRGGAIITWDEGRNFQPYGYDIYAQAVGSNGCLKWAKEGLLVCNSYDDQKYPKIASDGRGGAIILWVTGYDDYINTYPYPISAQSIDSTGNARWKTNGVLTCPPKKEPSKMLVYLQ